MRRLIFAFLWLCAAAKWPCRVEKQAALSILTMAQTASNDGNGISVQELLTRAVQLHQEGELEGALEAYDLFTSRAPKETDVAKSTLSSIHSNIGAIHSSYGNFEQARSSFQDAVEINPEDSMAHYNLAITLTSRLSNHRQALKHARLAAQIDSGNPSILHLIANILQSMGAKDEALRYFSMAEQASQVEDSSSRSEQGKKSDMAWGKLSSNRLATSKIGDVYTTKVPGRGAEMTMTCISAGNGAPLAFIIRELVTSKECSQIIEKAAPLMESSYVMGEDGDGDGDGTETEAYRSSQNAWLAPYSMPLLADIQQRLAELTGFDMQALVRAAEDLQVIRYAPGGQFKAHHDSTGFTPRLFTALMYLNDIEEEQEGGTWFPFAPSSRHDNTEKESSSLTSSTLQSVQDAIRAALDVERGEVRDTGLIVQPSAGDCVLFFNYLPDGSLDLAAVHAGLPLGAGAQREKWAANYWYGSLAK